MARPRLPEAHIEDGYPDGYPLQTVAGLIRIKAMTSHWLTFKAAAGVEIAGYENVEGSMMLGHGEWDLEFLAVEREPGPYMEQLPPAAYAAVEASGLVDALRAWTQIHQPELNRASRVTAQHRLVTTEEALEYELEKLAGDQLSLESLQAQIEMRRAQIAEHREDIAELEERVGPDLSSVETIEGVAFEVEETVVEAPIEL